MTLVFNRALFVALFALLLLYFLVKSEPSLTIASLQDGEMGAVTSSLQSKVNTGTRSPATLANLISLRSILGYSPKNVSEGAMLWRAVRQSPASQESLIPVFRAGGLPLYEYLARINAPATTPSELLIRYRMATRNADTKTAEETLARLSAIPHTSTRLTAQLAEILVERERYDESAARIEKGILSQRIASPDLCELSLRLIRPGRFTAVATRRELLIRVLHKCATDQGPAAAANIALALSAAGDQSRARKILEEQGDSLYVHREALAAYQRVLTLQSQPAHLQRLLYREALKGKLSAAATHTLLDLADDTVDPRWSQRLLYASTRSPHFSHLLRNQPQSRLERFVLCTLSSPRSRTRRRINRVPRLNESPNPVIALANQITSPTRQSPRWLSGLLKETSSTLSLSPEQSANLAFFLLEANSSQLLSTFVAAHPSLSFHFEERAVAFFQRSYAIGAYSAIRQAAANNQSLLLNSRIAHLHRLATISDHPDAELLKSLPSLSIPDLKDLAFASIQRHRLTVALAAAKLLVKKEPNPDTFRMLATVQVQGGHTNEALKTLAHARQSYPDLSADYDSLLRTILPEAPTWRMDLLRAIDAYISRASKDEVRRIAFAFTERLGEPDRGLRLFQTLADGTGPHSPDMQMVLHLLHQRKPSTEMLDWLQDQAARSPSPTLAPWLSAFLSLHQPERALFLINTVPQFPRDAEELMAGITSADAINDSKSIERIFTKASPATIKQLTESNVHNLLAILASARLAPSRQTLLERLSTRSDNVSFLARFQLGLEAMRQRNYQEATTMFEKVVDLPDGVSPVFFHGSWAQSLESQHMNEKAHQQYRKCVDSVSTLEEVALEELPLYVQCRLAVNGAADATLLADALRANVRIPARVLIAATHVLLDKGCPTPASVLLEEAQRRNLQESQRRSAMASSTRAEPPSSNRSTN